MADELAAGDREEGGGVAATADKGGGEGGETEREGCGGCGNGGEKGLGFVQGRLR